MSYDGSLKFDTKLDTKGFEKGVGKLKGVASKSLGVVNNMFKATGVAMTAIGGFAIKTGMEFESSMNRVGALSNATEAELSKLTDVARQLGKDTVFSATEASEAMQNLAMSGFKTGEIIDTMPGLLDIAAAGQVNLADATSITASTLRGFQMDASETGKLADVLAYGFTNSNTSLETLGESMKYVSPVASSLGFSVEETTAAIGKLGDAGIQGTQSGTALRAIMLRLVDPPKAAAETMAELGLEVTNAQGEMKTLPEIISDIELATKDMTEAEKAATLSKIAGTNASSALMALVNEGGESLAKFTEELENSGGTAERVAGQQIQGLKGELQLLGSALEEIGLKIYDSLDMPLGQVVNTFKTYIQQLDSAIAQTQAFKEALSGGNLGGQAREHGPGIEDMGDPGQFLADTIADIVTSIVLALTEAIPQIIDMGAMFVTSFLEGIQSNVPKLAETFTEIFTSIISAYITLVPKILEIGIDFITNLATGMSNNVPELLSVAKESMSSLIDAIIRNIPEFITAGVNIVKGLVEGLANNMPEIMSKGIELIVTLADAIIENIPTIIQVGLQLIVGIVKGIMENLPELIRQAPRIINEFANSIRGEFPTLIKTALEIMLEIAKGLIKAIPTLIANIPAIILAIYNAFMIYNWAGLGKKLITNLGKGIKGAASWLFNTGKSVAKGTLEAIKAWFRNGTVEGAGLVKNLIQGIRSVLGNILGLAREMAGDVVRNIKTAWSGGGITGIGKNLVQGLWNGINGAKDWILGKIKGFADSVTDGLKGFFGIHSPSKVFDKEIGTELIRGLMVGIQRETPELRKLSENEMMKLVDDYAVYGRKAAQAYGQLNAEEMAELRKKHLKERKITKNMTQKEINEVKKQRKQDGRDLAEAIAQGIEEKTNRVEQALSKLREQSIKQLDKLGQATISALEKHYSEQERLSIRYLDDSLTREIRASDERLAVHEREYLEKNRLLDEETREVTDMIQTKINEINAELDAKRKKLEEEEYEEKLALAKQKVLQAEGNKEKSEAQKEVDRLISERKRKEYEQRKKDEINHLKDQIRLVQDNAKRKQEEYKKEYDQKVEHEKATLQATKDRLEDEKESIRMHFALLRQEENIQAEARRLILAENNDELINLLDSYNPYWMDAGQSFGESLIDGLNSMKYQVQDVVDDMLAMVSTAEMANARIIQAKQDWHEANARQDKKAMEEAHKRAEQLRKQGGTIGKDVSINTAKRVNEVNKIVASERRVSPYQNGVTQNITIVSPKNTPSENARQMKRKGEELVRGY